MSDSSTVVAENKTTPLYVNQAVLMNYYQQAQNNEKCWLYLTHCTRKHSFLTAVSSSFFGQLYAKSELIVNYLWAHSYGISSSISQMDFGHKILLSGLLKKN